VLQRVVPETEKKKNKWISEAALQLAKEKRETIRLQMRESGNVVAKYMELCKQEKQ
jgi:hypothetical protein